jgi:hypothetical protein
MDNVDGNNARDIDAATIDKEMTKSRHSSSSAMDARGGGHGGGGVEVENEHDDGDDVVVIEILDSGNKENNENGDAGGGRVDDPRHLADENGMKDDVEDDAMDIECTNNIVDDDDPIVVADEVWNAIHQKPSYRQL